MSDNSILCYCATVKRRLQSEILTQALDQLIRYNEMLQVRLEGGRYVPEPEAPERQAKLLSIHDCAGRSPAEIETLGEQIIKSLAGEICCERDASIRVAILDLDQNFNKLLLLSHRSIADQRGLVLMLEDLYRIYEQLSNGYEVALRPVRKTYLEFIKEASITRKPEFDGFFIDSPSTEVLNQTVTSGAIHRTESGRPKPAAFSIFLDKKLRRRLFSWWLAEFELTPADALAGALLRSLAKADKKDAVSIYIKSDYRFADESLRRTVGALTRTYILPRDFAEECGLSSDIKKLRGILHDVPSRSLPRIEPLPAQQLSEDSNTDLRLRLNLEYLTDEPWLGGDEWLPEGFVVTEKSRLMGSYSIEVIPFLLRDTIEVFVGYQETPGAKAQAEKLAADLIPELEGILNYCEGYIEAKEFWVKEFGKAAAQTKIQVESAGHKVTGSGRASSACGIEKSILDRALLNFEGADESQILLAAYSVLVSRLNEREDLILLCALDKDGVNTVFPLRLNPTWTSSFKLLVEQLKDRLRQAGALGRYAFDIFNEEQLKTGRPSPVMDAGYIFKQTSAKARIERPAIHPSFNQDPDLALEIFESDGAFDIRFVYEKSRFDSETIDQFGVYLNVILNAAAADTNAKLGEIEFERDRNVYDKVNSLAEDAFNF